MPESISSANISRTAPAEWLLARVAGSTRATAILGDLTEMAQTRGRLWFWIAYARTLVSLGWRTPVAFLLAIASVKFMLVRVLHLVAHYGAHHLGDVGLFGEMNREVLWNLPMVIAQCLFFALPFVFVCYGRRNRLTQLACTLLLITIPVYTALPWVRDLSGVLTLLAIVAALLLSLWRRPVIVLAATSVTAIAVVTTCAYILTSVFHHRKVFACEAIGIAIALMVCSHLHGWLLEERPALIGDTHA